jgi:hypothetical protein
MGVGARKLCARSLGFEIQVQIFSLGFSSSNSSNTTSLIRSFIACRKARSLGSEVACMVVLMLLLEVLLLSLLMLLGRVVVMVVMIFGFGRVAR